MTITFPNVTGSIEVYMDCLKAICGDTEGKSMVDLGCCFAPNTPKLGFAQRTYIDAIERKLDHPGEQQFFHKKDVLELLIVPPWKQFDVALALDLIEHLHHNYGTSLIRMMETIGDKVIFFTPLGELFINGLSDNDPEKHRSGWTPEDFQGYASIVFPNYHKEWNAGAFFAWRCQGDMMKEFQRVMYILRELPWAEGMTATVRPAKDIPPGRYCI